MILLATGVLLAFISKLIFDFVSNSGDAQRFLANIFFSVAGGCSMGIMFYVVAALPWYESITPLEAVFSTFNAMSFLTGILVGSGIVVAAYSRLHWKEVLIGFVKEGL